MCGQYNVCIQQFLLQNILKSSIYYDLHLQMTLSEVHPSILLNSYIIEQMTVCHILMSFIFMFTRVECFPINRKWRTTLFPHSRGFISICVKGYAIVFVFPDMFIDVEKWF